MSPYHNILTKFLDKNYRISVSVEPILGDKPSVDSELSNFKQMLTSSYSFWCNEF